MNIQNEILQLASSGDGYVSIEKSNRLIRHLKQEGKLKESILFLLQLANTLIDTQQYIPSIVSAHRASKLVDLENIDEDVKKEFEKYEEKITKDCESPELYMLLDRMRKIIKEKNEEIIYKQIEIAVAKDNYHQAQVGYIRIMLIHLNDNDEKSAALIDDFIPKLTKLLWKWVMSIPSETQQVYSAQFIICRAVLAFLAQDGNGPNVSSKLFNFATEHAPENFPIVTPLFIFTKHYIQAVLKNSPASATYLKSSYEKLLVVDIEINKWVSMIYNNHLNVEKKEQNNIEMEGFNSFVESIFGSLQNLLPNIE